MNGKSMSVWRAARPSGHFEPLRGEVRADVAVVGGGITGLTAALTLAERGRSVVLLEKGAIGSGESGNTTAHLTEAVDARYSELRKRYGADDTRLIAEASRAALARIAALVEEHAIACRFRRVPGYLYTEHRNRVADLKKEAAAAKDAGLEAEWVTEVPLPFETRGAVLFRDQAQFHPLEYLGGLAAAAAARGVRIFERSMVREIRGGAPYQLEVEGGGRATASDVIQATNQPVFGFTLVHTKQSPWRTYAIALDAGDEPGEGLFWDTADPYHYVRWQETDAGRVLIVGGEDHRVGEADDEEERFVRLEEYARGRFGVRPVRYRWSGQIAEPHGGIPMIGGAKGMYVSTGYAGQGMTFGTLGAMIVSDLVLGLENRWAALFAHDRLGPHVATAEYVKENLPFARHLVEDRLTSSGVEAHGLGDVGPGEGKIVEVGGRKLAVYRAESGKVCALSPVCTHMKCDVAWNSAERTWDCPCHGSRFDPEGAVLNGPAHEPLRRIALERRGEQEGEEWRRERDSNPR